MAEKSLSQNCLFETKTFMSGLMFYMNIYSKHAYCVVLFINSDKLVSDKECLENIFIL